MFSITILDHNTLIFGFGNFFQVANDYLLGKFNKAVINHPNKSSREISNNLVHTMVKFMSDIPTRTKVYSSDGIDIKLADIVKILT